MQNPGPLGNQNIQLLGDAELVEVARQHHRGAFRVIMQRHNRRLYRIAVSVLRDDAEAEDVVQETYVRAFTSLESFRNDASLATWLTRIALNEALGRLRQRRPSVELSTLDQPATRSSALIIPFPLMHPDPGPEQATARNEIRRKLEQAIETLPPKFRIVLVMRDIEGLSVEDVAAQLAISPQTVRTRLHRARAQLRRALSAELAPALQDTFPFAGERCERLIALVLQRLQLSDPS